MIGAVMTFLDQIAKLTERNSQLTELLSLVADQNTRLQKKDGALVQ